MAYEAREANEAAGLVGEGWRDGRVPARWPVRAAHVVPLLTLPSALWRLAWVFAIPIGWDEVLYREATSEWHSKLYLLSLSLLSEVLALLTLGLVQSWGERLPRWVPLLGKRRIPPLAAIVPASLGAVALTVMWTPAPLMFFLPAQAGAPSGNGWAVLMAVCYLPLVAWGPLLSVVTWAYYRRRCTDLPQSYFARRRVIGGDGTGSGSSGAGRAYDV